MEGYFRRFLNLLKSSRLEQKLGLPADTPVRRSATLWKISSVQRHKSELPEFLSERTTTKKKKFAYRSMRGGGGNERGEMRLYIDT